MGKEVIAQIHEQMKQVEKDAPEITPKNFD